MGRTVYLHAGAHRTGTSSFQMCLAENRVLLSGQGLAVAYPRRDGVPGGRLRLAMPRPRHGPRRVAEFAKDIRRHLAALCPDPAQGLILSEENIPGPMRHFYEGRFFPASSARLAALAQALDAPPRHLLFVLRPYGELYVSAFRKRAEDNPVPPFETLVPRFLAMDRGWPELIAEFRDILKPERLSVLDYAHRGSSTALLSRLVPGLAGAPVEPQRVVNLSATDTALKLLQERYHAGENLPREVWQALIAAHADAREVLGFAQFSQTDAAILAARYASDLDRIAAMPGVAFG